VTARISLIFAWLLLAGACTSAPPVRSGDAGDVDPLDSTLPLPSTRVDARADVLVTFAMPAQPVMSGGGFRHSYHSGDDWQVPLYNRQQARRFAHDYGLTVADAWPIEILGVYCVAFAVDGGESIDAMLERLQDDPRPVLVQRNSDFATMTATRVSAYDDPLVDVQYGRFAEQLASLHAITSGEEVKVAVIDTSVDLEHPDLSGQVTRQVEFVPSVALEERMHGTAVTGVIGAAADNGEGLVGIAPRADIHVYAACARRGEETVCSSFSIAQALAEALDDGMEVINMSFAGPDDPLISALIGKAVTADTVLIAAGNADTPTRRFPAGLPGVHAADGEREFWFARAERLSTRAGGSYQVFFGSSIASAGMTGIAALVHSQSSTAETHALLDWLFDKNCAETAPPATSCTIDPDQLCD